MVLAQQQVLSCKEIIMRRHIVSFSLMHLVFSNKTTKMVFQWVINGVLIILNENDPINDTEMLLTVHHFLSKLK